MASYICINAYARVPYAEELITVTTGVVKPNPAFASKNQSLMARCRLEAAPIRFRFVIPPTSTTGTFLNVSDILELSDYELAALVETGGFTRDASAGADGKLWMVYYK